MVEVWLDLGAKEYKGVFGLLHTTLLTFKDVCGQDCNNTVATWLRRCLKNIFFSNGKSLELNPVPKLLIT